MLSRKTSNRVRFFLDEILPPIVRDSFLMMPLMRAVLGKHANEIAHFRECAHSLSPEEFAAYYKKKKPFQGETDNTPNCIREIQANIKGSTICDVGCGRGFLISKLAESPAVKQATGIDIIVDDAIRERFTEVEFFEGRIEDLPFADKSYDTVVCTHTLEHIPDLAGAIMQLRRICRHRLIIIVPMERQYKFGFNLHVNFFPYKYLFLKAMSPLPDGAVCKIIDGEIYYCEDRSHDSLSTSN